MERGEENNNNSALHHAAFIPLFALEYILRDKLQNELCSYLLG